MKKVRPILMLSIALVLVQLACVVETAAPPPDAPPTPPSVILEAPTPTTILPTPTPILSANVTHVQFVESLTKEEIEGILRDYLPSGQRIPAQYDVDTYRIRFQTFDENNELVETRADIRFPRVNSARGFPVFAYGSGTTGIGNGCATLDEPYPDRNWGNYRAHMLGYATQGYITVLPNWQGFDIEDRTHPYFILELEGRTILDAVRAVYKFFDNPPAVDILAQPTPAVFLGGYSQGGHGAFAGNVMASTYAPELNIKGIIGHAAAPNVEGLMYDSPPYTAFIIYAYREYYGEDIIRPEQVFQPRWLANFEGDAKRNCIDNIFRYYGSNPQIIYTQQFYDALYSQRLEVFYPQFKQKLLQNYSGFSVEPNVPAVILHGEQDNIVSTRVMDQYVAKMCNAGKNVTYNLYPDANHYTTRQTSFVDTLTWMQNILVGNTPESSCSTFFSNR